MSKDQPAAMPQTIGIGSHKPTDNFQGAQATNGSAADPIAPTYYVQHPDGTYSVANPQPAAIPPRSGGAEPNSAGLEARTGGSAATYGTLDNPIKVCRECRCHPCKCDPSQDLVREVNDHLPKEDRPAELWECPACFDLLRRLRDRIVEQRSWWRCRTHGDQPQNTWGCPQCVVDLRAQLAERVPPREPTTVMVNAGVNALRVTGGNIWDDARDVWRAMYDVAPPHPPNAEGPSAEEVREIVRQMRNAECPGSDCKVSDCLRDGTCGCRDGQAVELIERLAARVAAK